MDDRRAMDGTLLLDLLQRTARIEERGSARDAWQQRVDGKITEIDHKLDRVIAELQTAKTTVSVGAGIFGRMAKFLLPTSAAGVIGYVIHFFWPAR